MGNFSFPFLVSCIDGLDKFLEAGKNVGLVVVDHIVFDVLGKSIISLPSECCIAPLDLRLAAEI